MDEAAIYRELEGIFRGVFARPVALRPDLTARDVEGWDSFKQIELIIESEQAFGLKFTSRELDNFANLGDLVRVVAARGQAKPG